METNDYLTAPNCVLKLFVILAAIPLLDVCGEPELDPAPDGDGPLLPLHHGGHQQKVGRVTTRTVLQQNVTYNERKTTWLTAIIVQ